jgi:ribosomal protein S17
MCTITCLFCEISKTTKVHPKLQKYTQKLQKYTQKLQKYTIKEKQMKRRKRPDILGRFAKTIALSKKQYCKILINH